MTKQEQHQFAEELIGSVRAGVLRHIDSDNVPEDWDGHELRQWLADLFDAQVCNPIMRGRRLKEVRWAIAQRFLDRLTA